MKTPDFCPPAVQGPPSWVENLLLTLAWIIGLTLFFG